jgi:hypothetical protein
MKTELIPLSAITVKERLRYEDDEIQDLIDSIQRFGGEPNGLLQPILVDHNNILQDGFRRFTAVQRLGWTSVPVHRREALSDSEYFEIELETNFRRKQFTWRELIHAVVKIHKTRVKQCALEGKLWSQSMTGELLGGYSDSYVCNCIQLDKIVDNPDFDSCGGITDAVKILYRRKEDDAMRLLRHAPVGIEDQYPVSPDHRGLREPGGWRSRPRRGSHCDHNSPVEQDVVSR